MQSSSGSYALGPLSIGTTEDVALNAEEQPTSNHDIHASILHLMGMNHRKLTYYFNGRKMRLTDVPGELVPQITGTPKKA